MKNTIYQNTFGKYNRYSALAALMIMFLVVLGCGGGEKPSAPPTEAEVQTLVKATMTDFADAIEKEDFKAFREKASKEFRDQVPEDQIKTTFKTIIDNKATIVPMLRDAIKNNATFSPAPAVREEKGYSLLTANGSFDEIKFTSEYVYQDGKWKLLKIQFV
jgi:hypothetical protein